MAHYLKKNINMFLVIIIIICVGAVMGISTYYNQRYQIINNDYKEVVRRLNNETQLRTTAQQELGQLRSNFNKTSTDVAKYDTLYSDKVSELEDTQGSLSKTTNELKQTKSALVDMTNNFNTEKNKNTALQKEVIDKEDELRSCRSDLYDCEEDLDDCQDAS